MSVTSTVKTTSISHPRVLDDALLSVFDAKGAVLVPCMHV
jgi:hypothetical protein